MIASIYNIQTGVIRAVVETDDLVTMNLNVNPGEAIISGQYAASEVYITSNGPVAYPEKPNDYVRWNGSKWVDGRTIAEVSADLEALRDAARLSKAQTLTGLMGLGLIAASEAAAAAQENKIPASILSHMAGWTEAERAAQEIEWAAATLISRNNGAIALMVKEMGADPIELDQLFSVGS